jgi:hypothetical protein
MKFDSNLAWKQASAAIAANREVLLALAGVFLLLPTLAFGLMFPQPQPSPGMDREAMIALMSDYYMSALPYLLPMMLVQAIGTLALLTLLTDRTRPTVGQAIRLGAKGIVPYLLAQILVGIGVGIAGGSLLALGSATGVPAVAGITMALAVVVVAYVGIKTSLLAPVVVVEGQGNPIAALRRSWHLTRGNSVRIGLFYLLVIFAFLVIITIIMAIFGIVLALLAGSQTVGVATAVLSAALGTLMTLYLVAILASVHRQLAGPSAEAVTAPFV